MTVSASAGDAMLYMKNSISLAPYSSLFVEVDNVSGSHIMGISTKQPTNEAYGSGFTTNFGNQFYIKTNGIIEMPIQNYTGSYYFGIRINHGKSFRLHSIYLQ